MESEREKQKQELAEERRRLETQQAESQKMMAELLKLKQELSGWDGEAETAPPRDSENH